MLYRSRDKVSKKTLYTSKPLLITPKQAYVRPGLGREWFATTTTGWRVDELVRRRVRDWRRLTNETGHTGERTGTFRADHSSIYTGTHSVFPAPLAEWIYLRYAPAGGRVIDAFAGGAPRALVASIMGYQYVGFDIRKKQIDENTKLLGDLGVDKVTYIVGDGRFLNGATGLFDMALTCPPYWNLEVYSDLPEDLSNAVSYDEFNAGMMFTAQAHRKVMKPGSFVCIVVGPFRDKKTGELIDFPAHTVVNFQEAGFYYHQQIVLLKNFASAAKRGPRAWERGKKLVPNHEFCLVFKTPGEQRAKVIG